MLDVRPFASLGHANHGWLDATHHFSFAGYHDPQRMGWGNLRVWNDDIIAGQSGFPPHGHRDMEVITYVRTGAITHRDSMGNHGRTGASDVQVMSAGTGIQHSEFNLEDTATTLFQIWIQPDRAGDAPGWGQRPFPRADRAGQLITLASGMAEDAAALARGDVLPIRTDGRVAAAQLQAGQRISYTAAAGRHIYCVPATGRICLSGDSDSEAVVADARDGVAIRDEAAITIEALADSELVLVDSR